MTSPERLLLMLRVLMEVGVVAALAYWGANTGGSTSSKVALGIAAPAVAFGFWGAVDFHRAGRLAEPLRLVQELTISLLAALAWYTAGSPVLGLSLGALSILYHALLYLTGGRLLRPRPQAPAAVAADSQGIARS
jgi:Protein of unknown function (DUF2568)